MFCFFILANGSLECARDMQQIQSFLIGAMPRDEFKASIVTLCLGFSRAALIQLPLLPRVIPLFSSRFFSPFPEEQFILLVFLFIYLYIKF